MADIASAGAGEDFSKKCMNCTLMLRTDNNYTTTSIVIVMLHFCVSKDAVSDCVSSCLPA